MVDLVPFSIKALVPGSDTTEQNIFATKHVWQLSQCEAKVHEFCSYWSACDVTDIYWRSAPSDNNGCSTTSSVTSLVKKEGQVKLMLATLCKQLDEKRF